MSKTITLRDGASSAENVVLNNIKIGVLSGRVSLPAGVSQSRFEQFYRFKYPGTLCDFPDAGVIGAHAAPSAGAFTFDLPDLTRFGAELCISKLTDDNFSVGALGPFMRKVREVLRLHYECGRTQREIARSCGIGTGTVSDYLKRARASDLIGQRYKP